MNTAVKIIKIVTLMTVALFVIFTLRNFGHSVVVEELKKHTILGFFLYFLFMVGSVVFVAIPAVPLWPVALITFGFWQALILTVLAINLGAWISFLIARKWGSGVVSKLLGKDFIKKTKSEGLISTPSKFFLLRMLGNNAFDLVSYIGGLSRLDPLQYGLITFLTSAFWIGLSFYGISKVLAINSTLAYVASIGAYLVVIAVGAWLLKYILKAKKI